MMLEKIEETEIGFEVVKFDDWYGNKCSLQQSSLAKSAIWLGVNGIKNRMHLDLEQVKELVDVLNRWIENGSFKDEK